MPETGTSKRWRIAPCDHEQQQAAEAFARELNVHPLVALLLQRRGLGDSDTALAFLQPKLTQLHDPALLPGAMRAAERLAQAVRDGQPIVVYGDYDVDGITAASILWHMLSHANANVSTYVPHRIDEGYGLSCTAIEQLASEHDNPLIISVDCGITAVEPAATAKRLGVDLVITDHHQFDNDLPDAHTLVHPGLNGEGDTTYPFDGLCGAGVAFKVGWQFARAHTGQDKLPDTWSELLIDLLSLVALGTVADVVPLRDENRVITHFGLRRIKKSRIAGLQAMIDSAGLSEEKVDSYHVGFVLGPRLNACGRMGHARQAVDLLTTADAAQARETATFLTKENERRRRTERDIFEQARQMVLDHGYDQPDCRAIVLAHEDWHPGVVGIVASRIVDAFHRPAIVLNVENGEAHGSARSVDGVSIHEALCACDAHLSRFGGHAMAAGLHLNSDGIDAFRDALVAHVNQMLAPDDLTGVVDIDAQARLPELTLDFLDQLEALAPFGRDNRMPTLCVLGAQLDRAAERIGQGGKHLRLWLRQDGRSMPAVAFGMGDRCEDLPGGARVDVAFEAKRSSWQGRERVDIIVQDVRPA